MKQLYFVIAFIFLFVNANAQEKKDLKPYWNNGLNFSSPEKDFSVKIGGRIQYDLMFMSQDSSLNSNFDALNGTEFRRLRLYTSGTVFKSIKYKLQLDFSGNKVDIKDAYIKFTKIPWVGNFTVGNFKEPRGFEMICSSNFISFMERSLVNVYDNDRNLGI
ncbi:MAG: hypothetical protein C0598_05730, partial [Marinilabiliales bacterium]